MMKCETLFLNRSVFIIALLTSGLLLGLPANAAKAADITGGILAPHVNLAAFHTLRNQKGFVFPKHIADDNILSALKGKAQYVFMNHTAGLKDGDVITVANDVLRDNAGDFEDFGMGCQLSVKLKGKDVTLSGLCHFFLVDKNNQQIKHKGIIKQASLAVNKGWVLIYYAAEDGIAIYANEEFGWE
ncbi:MAG: hypothetical protein Q9M44_06235 [Ghiorsea sp.]|nr:hypothetical protein [Ghiorsea sp.]